MCCATENSPKYWSLYLREPKFGTTLVQMFNQGLFRPECFRELYSKWWGPLANGFLFGQAKGNNHNF